MGLQEWHSCRRRGDTGVAPPIPQTWKRRAAPASGPSTAHAPRSPHRLGWARGRGGGWRRSYGNCAGWLNKERAARRRSPAASISAADAAPWEARPTFYKFLLPPRSSLRAGEGGRRLERQGPAQEKAGRGEQPRGGGEGCKVRVEGECEGDPGLPGSSAVCPGPEERREALAGEDGGTTLVQNDGFTQFRLSEASGGL